MEYIKILRSSYSFLPVLFLSVPFFLIPFFLKCPPSAHPITARCLNSSKKKVRNILVELVEEGRNTALRWHLVREVYVHIAGADGVASTICSRCRCGCRRRRLLPLSLATRLVARLDAKRVTVDKFVLRGWMLMGKRSFSGKVGLWIMRAAWILSHYLIF